MAELKDLPRRLTRVCCPGKNDGETQLYLAVEATIDETTGNDIVIRYQYLRESNDEEYFRTATIERMLEKIDDPFYIYKEN